MVATLSAVGLVWFAAYRFLFQIDEANLLTLDSPDGIASFSVRDAGGRTLWEIAASPARPLSTIHYGTLPMGFRQVSPQGPAVPRPLRRGETLKLRTETPSWFKEHSCDATGISTVICGGYEQGPLRSTRVP